MSAKARWEGREQSLMSSAVIACIRVRPASVGITLLALAGSLYASVMGPRLWTQAVYGPICSGHAVWAMHCPACWAALALAGAGAMAIAQSIARI
jgi:hypothetical protein